MKAIRTILCISTLVCCPALLVACGGGDQASQQKSPGRIHLPLTAQGTSGIQYHLSGAFDIVGPDSQVVAADGMSTSLSVQLQTGNYTIALQSGWQLSRVEGNTLVPVQATLNSSNPQPFVINENAVTELTFNFGTEGENVGFGNGELSVVIEVDDIQPESNCQDGIDNDNDSTVDCLDSDCSTAGVCTGAESSDSRCSNGFDDDGDALVDCDDPQCVSFCAP